MRCLESSDLGGSEPETLLDRLEHVMGVIIRLDEATVFAGTTIVQLLQSARRCLQEAISESTYTNRPTLVFSGNSGRPKYDIPIIQLQYLIENGFSIRDISVIAGVSERTISRRLQQYGLSIRQQYSQVNDAELDAIVACILNEFPNCGYRRMSGFLRVRGFRIQQKKIRSSVKRVDPEGVLLRSIEIHVIKRRSYNVPAPMSLWHVDGYHKLIRYASYQYCR